MSHSDAAAVGRAWVEIDLLAIADNVRAIRAALSPASSLMAVIKADACGHGLLPVARAVLGAGASALGVARLEEAALLREAGIGAPLYLLGYNPPAAAEDMVRLGLVTAVSSRDMARALAAAAGRAGVRWWARFLRTASLWTWGLTLRPGRGTWLPSWHPGWRA